MRIALLGAGHLGKIHLKCILATELWELVGFYDPDEKNAASAIAQYGARRFSSPAALLREVDAVDIVTPTPTHYRLAAQAMRAGKHVFIEKPVTATVAEGRRLLKLAAETGVQVQVGHVERFNPAYLALRDMALRPMFIECHRLAAFQPRGTEVSVILDLMIHDLDLILALIDSPIVSVDAVGAAVASAHEDIANARLRFESGAVATITASRISARTERRMRIFAQDAYLAADFSARKLTVVRRGEGQKLPGVPDFGMSEVAWEDHDSLEAEHAAFVASALDGAPVVVDAAAGRRALAAALEVAREMAESQARMAASGLITPPA